MAWITYAGQSLVISGVRQSVIHYSIYAVQASAVTDQVKKKVALVPALALTPYEP